MKKLLIIICFLFVGYIKSSAQLSAPVHLGIGGNSEQVVTLDIDSDGVLEIFVSYTNVCFLWKQDSLGNYSSYSRHESAIGSMLYGPELCFPYDINFDGFEDVVLSVDGILFTFLSDGVSLDDSARVIHDFNVNIPNCMIVGSGDIDNNDHTEIFVSSYANGLLNKTYVFYDIGLAPNVFVSVDTIFHLQNYSITQNVVVKDMDGDGLQDIAYLFNTPGTSSADTIRIRYQDPTGNWTEVGTKVPMIGSSGSYRGIFVDDIDYDGDMDVAVLKEGNTPDAKIFLFENLGNRTFDVDTLDAHDLVDELRFGDLDGDGRKDIVTCHGGAFAVATYKQRCDGSFEPYITHSVNLPNGGWNTPQLQVAHLNSDSLLDIVVTNSYAETHILYNQSQNQNNCLKQLLLQQDTVYMGDSIPLLINGTKGQHVNPSGDTLFAPSYPTITTLVYHDSCCLSTQEITVIPYYFSTAITDTSYRSDTLLDTCLWLVDTVITSDSCQSTVVVDSTQECIFLVCDSTIIHHTVIANSYDAWWTMSIDTITYDSVTYSCSSDTILMPWRTISSIVQDTSIIVRLFIDTLQEGFQLDSIWIDTLLTNSIIIGDTTISDWLATSTVLETAISFIDSILLTYTVIGCVDTIDVDTIISSSFFIDSLFTVSDTTWTTIDINNSVFIVDSDLVIKIYPNPATDYLILEIDEKFFGSSLGIIDNLGRVLITQDSVKSIKTSIDISMLLPGMYILRYGSYTTKFICR